MTETVVKLKHEQEPPQAWKGVGHVKTDHVYVDSVEETDDGEAYRLTDERTAEGWYLSTSQVQDIREPSHPSHPSNRK